MWTPNAAGVFESQLLKDLPWLTHGFGSRLSPDWPGEYTELKQVHSDIVFVAAEKTGCLGEGDALVSATPGQKVGIRTADCVPVLLADPDRQVVAAVHAGWRGTVAGIVGGTVAQMRQQFGCEPSSIRAAIGPSIGKCCFEVGPEVSRQFHAYTDGVQELTHLDLAMANFRQLQEAGLRPDYVDASGLCTMCDIRFHSFRRDKALAGRMVAAIGINLRG